MTNLELKPCPFCGGQANLHPSVCRINCEDCPVVMVGVQGRDVMIEAWNRRQEQTIRHENTEAVLQNIISNTLEACAKLAENMPLKADEMHEYRASDDCKAMAWDVACAIRGQLKK